MKIKVLVLTQLKVISKANSLNVRLMSVWLLLRIRLANQAVLEEVDSNRIQMK